MKPSFSEYEFDSILDLFKFEEFSTHDFIQSLSQLFPDTWKAIQEVYGSGGKGASRHYSANSRVAHTLSNLSAKGKLDKLEYRKADPSLNWGHPDIRYWVRDKARTINIIFPDEVDPNGSAYEDGAQTKVYVNKYERDPEARIACIAHHGLKCSVCEFDFEAIYGTRGKGFIHVHHLVAVSTYGGAKPIDPIVDLVPVCPNCHAMLHRKKDDMTIDALQKLIISQR